MINTVPVSKLQDILAHIVFLQLIKLYNLKKTSKKHRDLIIFATKGSPSVKFTFDNDLPRFLVNLLISSKDNSPLNILGSPKSIKQNEHFALYLLVMK